MINHHHSDHALKNLHHEIIDKSWLTLSLPYHDDASLYSTLSQPSSSSSSSSLSSTSSSSSPPRPSPFVYTPLTPPTRRPTQIFLFPQIISPTLQLYSQPDPDLIVPRLLHHNSSLSQDSHQEKQEQDHVSLPNPITSTSNNSVLKRRQSSQQPSCATKRRKLKTGTIPPPFPWATSKRATLHTLDHLLSELKLKTISGTLQCKSCKFQQEVQIDLVENFKKVTEFMEENIHEMLDRAPDIWLHPVLPKCQSCGKEKAMEPLNTKKRNINWLFLLLSQTIGCCTLDDLKYFCKHNDTHRTGAKDRLLYSTYFGLCKQLQPNIDFYP
ncbi:hypothetical protein TSUD_337040 [Trifolium subterraneum]|uniref:DUF7086 domain-containing protein n=1 Tax=Trifolium subterraneum TaxID=3900 RepID=A0A2Z6LVU7_TRISU|nr:hypothetical protein TSUD_337040 [Trifolium subterraneum]